MSRPRPIGVSFGGLNPGERPYVDARYSLDGPEMDAFLTEVFIGEPVAHGPIIVYGDSFADDSPRQRQAKAQELVKLALGEGPK